MSAPLRRRPRRLFPRPLGEVVQAATQPLMEREGKLMGALLREWESVVGPERARISRPERLQFTGREGESAVLHVLVRPAAAPSLTYACEAMLEDCARYFGYRAIGRIVLHASHSLAGSAEEPPATRTPRPAEPCAAPDPLPALPPGLPEGVRDALSRIAQHIGSGIVKKDSER